MQKKNKFQNVKLKTIHVILPNNPKLILLLLKKSEYLFGVPKTVPHVYKKSRIRTSLNRMESSIIKKRIRGGGTNTCSQCGDIVFFAQTRHALN